MEISQIIPHIEALIFASDKPLTSGEITELVNNAMGFIEDRATQEQVDAALAGICEKYNAEFYPFEVRESGGGWQFLTKKTFYKTVGQLNGDKFLKRLSNAALETLAIIAYKQPITKSEIEAIRGVNCDYAVQKLLEKDLVVITGRREDAVGHPLIYATSKSFMDYFGINSADELPKISEVMMEELVKATLVNPLTGTTEEADTETDAENPIEAEAATTTALGDEAALITADTDAEVVTDEQDIPGNGEIGSDDDAETSTASPLEAENTNVAFVATHTDGETTADEDADPSTDTAVVPTGKDADELDIPGNGEPGSDDDDNA